jgi:transcription initiation factor IIE alpha subunit
MDIQKIVLLGMRRGIKYTSKSIGELTGLSTAQTGPALKRLYDGGVIERERKGRGYEYESKQSEISF